MAIGQLRGFLRWQPPWGTTEDDMLEIADVQWYRPCGTNASLRGAPQVSRQFKSHIFAAPGNLILADEILPVPVCLVPHLENSQWWQAFVSEC